MKTGCVSIVIPIYNEEANLPELLRRCLEMGRALDRAYEIVLVDDGSKDGSRQMLTAAAERDPAHVVAVLLNRNGNLTLVELPDGREEWIAPHEIVSERDEPTRRFPRVK